MLRPRFLTVIVSLVTAWCVVYARPATSARSATPRTVAPAPQISAGTLATGPQVSAKSAILMDRATGRVLWEKDADLELPMASTTKIMTAMVILDHGSNKLYETVTVSQEAAGTGGSSVLGAGDQVTLENLLRAGLIHSSNEAMAAAAEYLGGNQATFVGWMNDKAKALGLKHTHFKDPHGLCKDGTDGHHSSARDLALMARYALIHYPLIREIVQEGYPKSFFIPSSPRVKLELHNRNRLLGMQVAGIPDAHYDGVKTGWIEESGPCYVCSASRGDNQLISVVLDSADIFADCQALTQYGFQNYTWRTEASPTRSLLNMPVQYVKWAEKPLELTVAEEESGPTSNASGVIAYTFRPKGPLKAPIRKGAVMGEMDIICSGRVLATVPAVAFADVPVSRSLILGVYMSVILVIVGGFILVAAIISARSKAARRCRRVIEAQG